MFKVCNELNYGFVIVNAKVKLFLVKYNGFYLLIIHTDVFEGWNSENTTLGLYLFAKFNIS